MGELESLRRPAIKAGMGNWTYYISTMTYKQLATYVKMPFEVYKSKETSERVQRALDDKHVERIATYLKKEEDRFFDAIVLSILGGKPKWYPGVFEKEGESYYSIGIVELSGDEGIFPIDGQHRLQAIKNIANDVDPQGQEEIPVIFIVHGDEEKNKEKMRRLFTSLNRYAKPINLSDFIALDEDDFAAITTRYLAENTERFKDKILYSKTESMNRDDQQHFINIISFYKCNDYLLGAKVKEKTQYKRQRPSDEAITAFQNEAIDFWEALIKENPDVEKFFSKGICARSKFGGNILFRPRGIVPYVDAVAIIHKKRPSVDYLSIMKSLASVDMDLNSDLWKGVLWNGEMLSPGHTLVRDMFIYLYDSNLLSTKKIETIISKISDKKGVPMMEVQRILEVNRAK
jgi:DNA sulfur modification protein DndB